MAGVKSILFRYWFILKHRYSLEGRILGHTTFMVAVSVVQSDNYACNREYGSHLVLIFAFGLSTSKSVTQRRYRRFAQGHSC